MNSSSELVHRYTPRGTARTLLESRAPEIIACGAAGTGKTRAAMEKLHLSALLNPGMRGLIVRKTLTSLGSTTLVTWRQQVAVEALANGTCAFYGGSRQEAAAYRYNNGSTIVVGGMDRPTRIMSSEYDLIIVDEAIELSEDDWESLTTRLRHGRISFQQLIGCTNPERPTHWLHARAQRGQTLMLNSRHEENPVYYNDDGTLTGRGRAYMATLDALTGPRYLRLRKGLWAAAEGLVFDGFEPSLHLVDRFTIPEDWPRLLSVDFGFTNPFVGQCWRQDPDGRLWLEWEVYHTQRLVEDHAAAILDQLTVKDPDYRHPAGQPRYAHHGRTWTKSRPVAVICDHDAEDRATLERHLGLATIAARKTVSDGIQAVQARLRPAGDGKPRLFLLRDAVIERDQALLDAKKPACTADELPGYVWDTGKGKQVREQPVKVDDHGCDGMRYMVAQADLVGWARVSAPVGAAARPSPSSSAQRYMRGMGGRPGSSRIR